MHMFIIPVEKHPYGLAEIKCPYKYRNACIKDAYSASDFCSQVTTGSKQTQLKQSHPYFSQIQGQLATTGRSWCEIVLYTNKGIAVETIEYDQQF